MNAADPLAALNPLREPAAIAWWPPAPGWWLLLGFALVTAALLARWLLRRRRRNSHRRLALQRLDALCERQRADPDPQAFVAAVNALLKSVAVRSFGPRSVAAEHGERWIAFLNRTAPGGSHFDDALADAAYRPGQPALDLDRLSQSAAQWIRHHRGTP